MATIHLTDEVKVKLDKLLEIKIKEKFGKVEGKAKVELFLNLIHKKTGYCYSDLINELITR